ncbi:glucokinase-like ROK family protein [Evansella vedderi]|uniref:Glucokinase-like ROK family protein n=1 Tax=Evansella vedderi TaxID=38282 RepID=A0ABT9ZZ15_9BACI|nr:ROK family transcriptional regulator [Evansella vedderi]MDQ0256089.1 glucokinase-like ROK family protein [Evansella vedderi]
MDSQIAGSFQLMKSMNRSLVLNTIRINGSISRAEVAKKTKLTPPTVTNIVSELLKEDLILERNTGVSSGGRKPILLTINPNHYVIGVDVGVRKIRYALSDLDGNLLISKVQAMPLTIDEEGLLDIIIQLIEEILDDSRTNLDRVIGIGVAMHGIVDSKSGISLYAPTLGLRNIPIKQRLEKSFQMPVRVENDAKSMALGEKWFGMGKDDQNLISINVGEGIGAGVILNNRIFDGNDSIAGEIGHTIIDLDGPQCSCGSFGCFQTYASGQALRERTLKEVSLGRKTLLTDKANGDYRKIDGPIIYQCALAGDPLSIEMLEKTGRYIGIGIVNVIHLFNPSLVIIGGGVSKAGDFILEPLKEIVQSRALTSKAKESKIILSALGEEGSLIGAVTLVLSDMFVYH